MSGPERWQLLAGFARLLADAPEGAGEYEGDLLLIQLLEAAVNDLDRGAHLERPLAFRLTAGMRNLLVALFRARVERDQYRASLRLLEQGQATLNFEQAARPFQLTPDPRI